MENGRRLTKADIEELARRYSVFARNEYACADIAPLNRKDYHFGAGEAFDLVAEQMRTLAETIGVSE